MGSLVASDFEENSKIMGNPATSFEEFKKMRKNMKEYLNDK